MFNNSHVVCFISFGMHFNCIEVMIYIYGSCFHVHLFVLFAFIFQLGLSVHVGQSWFISLVASLVYLHLFSSVVYLHLFVLSIHVGHQFMAILYL